MRSEDKWTLELKPKPNGEWLYMRFPQPTDHFVPGFIDLARVIRCICELEDKKYPPPKKGREFVWEFLNDVVHTDLTMEALMVKYKIPVR